MLESVPSHQLADIMASIVNATFNEKLDILNAVDLKIRFEKALPLLLRQIEGVKLLQEKQELEKREGMMNISGGMGTYIGSIALLSHNTLK